MTYTRVHWIPPGDAGTRATLHAMRRLVRASLADPLLIATVGDMVGEGSEGWAWKVRRWLDDRWRFLPDPLTVELVREPRVMLHELRTRGYMAGDCDDAAVMAAALGMAGGRFVGRSGIGSNSASPGDSLSKSMLSKTSTR